MHWKSFFAGIVISIIIASGYYWLNNQRISGGSLALVNPQVPSPTPKPLLQYSFSNLKQYQPIKSQIELKEQMFDENNLTAYLGTYKTGGKTMTLQVIIPKSPIPKGGYPVILMNRGFVDASIYQTGVGTKNAARYFASNGFVTIAPDFLGYGQSDPPPQDTIEARLERPRQLMDILASMPSLSNINPNKIGIWGHSNGGNISLSVLEITGKSYPTVLWAPVTKPFPYSVLYYTDDSADQGKSLRQVVANFEKDYDVYDFSIDKYFDWINAPIQLHQGSADDAVPVTWSTAFTKILKDKGKQIDYHIYSGGDHNLRPDWNTVADRSLKFFQDHLQ